MRHYNLKRKQLNMDYKETENLSKYLSRINGILSKLRHNVPF